MALNAGSRIGSYTVTGRIGRGGMGEIYRARDSKLDRDVAIKVLPAEFASSPERVARFEREAKTLASLNHPNIAAIHGLEDGDGTTALVLELVEGPTLADRIARGPIPVTEALPIATQIAGALEAAHESGVVHRDLKPANIKIRPDGTVKVLDFGLAKAIEPASAMRPSAGHAQSMSPTMTTPEMTHAGMILGTPAYMSPEQTRGQVVDRRADVWAFGCVLYEMLTGRAAFSGETTADVTAAVLGRDPDWTALPAATPEATRRLLHRCLQKDPERRLPDIADARSGLREAHQHGRSWRPAVVASSVGLSLIALIGIGALWSWPAEPPLAEIEQFLEAGEWEAAFATASEYEAANPGNPLEDDLWERFSWVTSILTDPPGARVFRRPYDSSDEDWEFLGTSPVENIRIPLGLSLLGIDRDGYQRMERPVGGEQFLATKLDPAHPVGHPDVVVHPQVYSLVPEGTPPDGMVPVSGWSEQVAGERTEFSDFRLGQFEVTNAEFKAFVDAGGYERRELWEPPFITEDGREVSWEGAMGRFIDQTNRRGPKTWEVGTYPDGQEDYPVAGVSWYEAAAYARWKGTELPTFHHWKRAVASTMLPWQLPASNLGGAASAAVGSYKGIGWLGTYDMTGNVREWTASASGDQRIIVGGGWDDEVSVAAGYIVRPSLPPMDRSPANGFRLADLSGEADDVIARASRLPERQAIGPPEPVDDEDWDDILEWYRYDPPGPRNANPCGVQDSQHWRRECMTVDTAYGQPMDMYLYLPTKGSRPYQTVLYWPAFAATVLDSIDGYPVLLDFILKSGRAVAVPIFNGTFERRYRGGLPPLTTTAGRDLLIEMVKDGRRAIDYLQTREDIDGNKIALFGYSWGVTGSAILMATEPTRIKVGVLYAGGAAPRAGLPPAVDVYTFLPRIKGPVVMLNGKLDTIVHLESSVLPFFAALGTSGERKRLVTPDTGHSVPPNKLRTETLDWLDKYLGPV